MKMSQINPQYVLSAFARDKLESQKLILQYPDDLNMDYIQNLPFPQLYPNNSFDIIPVQFNSMEFMIYLGFHKDIATFLYMKPLMVNKTYAERYLLVLTCKEWIKKRIDDNNISNASILPNSDVGNWMMNDMGLREVVITDINRLWIEAKKNPIMMQNYLDTQDGRIKYKDLTLKDYVMAMINQRLEKLEIFDKDVQTHISGKTIENLTRGTTEELTKGVIKETTEEVIEKEIMEPAKEIVEESTGETPEGKTQKIKGRKKVNHYKKKKSKGRKR